MRKDTTKKQTIKDVNRLLSEAFGVDVRGDYLRRRRSFAFFTEEEPVFGDELDLIVMKNGSSYRQIGHFRELNGSSLEFNDESHREKFEKYANLYQRKFGMRPLTIRVTN